MSGALLFDLDGTLVDADHLHHEAWSRTLAPFGVEIGVARYRSEIMGFPNDMILGRLVPDLPRERTLALAGEKEVLFRALATELEPATGLVAFLDWLDARGARYGVVTNAPRANAEQELAGIGLADRFEVVVIGDELAHPKPHPLPYLTGLERLGAVAGRSLAFEDSLSGLRSARAAGLAVVGLTTGLSAERLLEEGAALAVPHFADARLKAFVAERLDGRDASAAAAQA
ncbi:HAD family hydrolase [Labrys wisconsinensis]|uniref:HAD superfamily hydrolase (TIGR01509 family) n=1 Tax=Labrys wisconsinensis TaxID=425677 RepID=A0ABU0J9C4_9HYPH|nr:HAD-IA family hydrolase [Labrys wisconsinensis]MDQ0470872.1 HAD superfamily hydrolase (TIGR01509 family) [Labrys wisconsinensis]